MKINYEFVENVMKAGKYGKAAVESLIPTESRTHFKNVQKEMKALIVSLLVDSDTEQMHTETSKENGDKDSKVKKISID